MIEAIRSDFLEEVSCLFHLSEGFTLWREGVLS